MAKPQNPHYHLNYLVGELLMLAWAASVQRANAYRSVSGAERRPSPGPVRKKLLAFIERDLLPHYAKRCTEAQHVENLLSLRDYGSRIGESLFGPEGYRLGIVQKFFNLLLKSLWSLGLIAEPPHCPVDRLIIGNLSDPIELNWTEITTVEEYLLAINAMKAEAALHRLSLAAWELRRFERRDQLTLDLSRLARGRANCRTRRADLRNHGRPAAVPEGGL